MDVDNAEMLLQGSSNQNNRKGNNWNSLGDNNNNNTVIADDLAFIMQNSALHDPNQLSSVKVLTIGSESSSDDEDSDSSSGSDEVKIVEKPKKASAPTICIISDDDSDSDSDDEKNKTKATDKNEEKTVVKKPINRGIVLDKKNNKEMEEDISIISSEQVQERVDIGLDTICEKLLTTLVKEVVHKERVEKGEESSDEDDDPTLLVANERDRLFF